jgi:signal transduction histidine kinase
VQPSDDGGIIRRVRRMALVLASALLALSLVGLVWFDYRATRAELLGVMRGQAVALRQTVSAAARSNRAAAALSEAQLGQRLLDQARALAALDREGGLTPAAVDEVVRRDPLLRVGVFAADGRRELAFGSPTEAAGGATAEVATGHGLGLGPGRGRGGGGQVVRQILEDGRDEVVTGVHAPRWGGGERQAAGVRRRGGGAIVVTVDASAVAHMQEPASLEALLRDVTAGSPEIAYVLLEHGNGRLSFGELPAEGAAAPLSPGERTVTVAGRPVLEFTSDVEAQGGAPARLRLGLRLDGLRSVERRMLGRLVLSLLVASGTVGLALSLAGLGKRYGALTRRHALAEEALRRRDRLAAMGELASTVAHEVRNPLNAVGMTAQRLRREFLDAADEGSPQRAELEELLSVMAAETQRIDRIVQQFLDYARPPRLAPEPVDLGPLVAGITERMAPLGEARGVALRADTKAAGRVVVDPSQLRQAVDNLVRNAIEATPEGGRVEVVARCGAEACTISVHDTGRGIEPDHLPRIFDLYFTTKADGTGVGLAVAQQIVSAHGGTIEVDSQPAAGTTMTIRLPGTVGVGRG